MGQYIFVIITTAFFMLLINITLKLIVNGIAVKTVSVIYKKTDDSIFGEIFGRAFLYGFLSDLLGYFTGTIALIAEFLINNNYPHYELYYFSWPIALFAGYNLSNPVIIIFSVALSMTLIFVFCYSKVLTETDLSKKQRIISALIIALINAQYYFLFSIVIPL